MSVCVWIRSRKERCRLNYEVRGKCSRWLSTCQLLISPLSFTDSICCSLKPDAWSVFLWSLRSLSGLPVRVKHFSHASPRLWREAWEYQPTSITSKKKKHKKGLCKGMDLFYSKVLTLEAKKEVVYFLRDNSSNSPLWTRLATHCYTLQLTWDSWDVTLVLS